MAGLCPWCWEAPGTQRALEPDEILDTAPRGKSGCPGLVQGAQGWQQLVSDPPPCRRKHRSPGWSLTLAGWGWLSNVAVAGGCDRRSWQGASRGVRFIPVPALPPVRANLHYLVSGIASWGSQAGIYIMDLAMYKTTKTAKANRGAEICLIEK